MIRHNAITADEARVWASIVFEHKAFGPMPGVEVPSGFFTAAARAYARSGPALERIAKALREEFSVSGRSLYAPLRYALTGREDGPELARLLELMPPDVVEYRLNQAEVRC